MRVTIMCRKPGAQPRIADERFKTTESVSRALFALAEAGGKTKQELIHEIVAGWVEEKITAARLLVAFADGEGVPGNAGDCPGNAGV